MASSSFAVASASASASLVTTAMPLTTIFSPPPSCSERPFTYFTDDGETSTFWRDMYLEDTKCYPYSYAYQHEPTISAVYSPGVCPEAYYAAQYTANGPTGAQTSWCCPSGMTYGNYACQSLATAPTIAILNESTNVSMTTPFIAADWYIQVAWAATELNTFTPKSAPVLTTTSTSASSISSVPTRVALGTAGPTKAASSIASASASSTESSTADQGLSTGAKAGIGVGVALGCIALASAIAFVVLTRRRKRKWAAGAGSHAHGSGNMQDVKYAQVGAQPADIHEASDTSRMPEMQGQEYRAELEGGWQGHEMRAK